MTPKRRSQKKGEPDLRTGMKIGDESRDTNRDKAIPRAGDLAETQHPRPAVRNLVFVGLPVFLVFQMTFATRLFLSDKCVARGDLLRQTGLPDRARDAYEKALARQPKDYKTAHLLGGTLVALGNNAEAAEVLERCVYQAPYHPLALDLLAIAYMHQGNLDKAAEMNGRAKEVVPTSPRPYRTGGRILAVRGQHEDAIAEFRKALDLGYSPKSEILRAIANAYLNSGSADLAVQSVAEAISYEPTDPLNHLVYGQMLANMQQWQPASAALQRAIELFEQPQQPSASLRATGPYRVHAHLVLASVYIRMERLADAVNEIFRAQCIDNAAPQIGPLIEQIAQRLDTGREGMDEAEEAQIRFLLARSLFASEQLDRGLDELRHVCGTETASARLRASAHTELARMLVLGLGKHAEALAELDRAEQIDPSLPEIGRLRSDILRYRAQNSGT